MELFLSFLLLISIVIAAIGLVANLYGLAQNMDNSDYFQRFPVRRWPLLLPWN